jgi:hypothetical protein
VKRKKKVMIKMMRVLMSVKKIKAAVTVGRKHHQVVATAVCTV